MIDRVQSAGLGDATVPIETIREVGNKLVVDKIPTEPDFTFTIESLDVSTDLMAWLCGAHGSATEPGGAPGAADPAGTTEYKWENTGYVNVASPWKDALADAAGTVVAGHLIPAYYPTRVRYQFGVTDFASMTVELGGGTFYYAKAAPVEEYATGDGTQVAFPTTDPAIAHRLGGPAGTTFRYVFGVIVGGVTQIEGVDYTVAFAGGIATITFAVAPAAAASVRFAYFTSAAKAYPQAVHASTVVKPGAVRGRNVVVYLGTGGARQRMSSVQTFELEATCESEVEREMGNDEPTGRVVNSHDCTGSMTVRAKDSDAFIALLAKVTGVLPAEVFGYLNQNPVPLEVQIQNPKNPGTVIKTLYVSDAIFQVPGTPARVNAPTDFSLRFDSQNGTFSEWKGAKA